MTTIIRSRVQALIEDTSDAFLSFGGGINTDYAEFAGQALSEFKTALRDPTLTRSQLVAMLRSGMAKSQCEDRDQWSILMAHQLKTSINPESIGAE